MKTPTKKLMKFLVKKETAKWLDSNPTFVKDMENLVNEMIMFEVKYGVKILYEFEKANKNNPKLS